MKINLARFIFIIAIVFIAATHMATKAFAAPSITFDPASASVAQNANASVNLRINVDTQSAYGADAIVLYTPSEIDVVSVTNGGFFTDFSYANDSSNGRLELHGSFGIQTDSKSGSGTFATLTLKAKNGNGAGSVHFACTGSGNDTFILNTSGTNILSCSSLNQLALTFTGGTNPTNTPTNTPTPTPPLASSGATPTSTPIPGQNVIPTCASLTISPSGTLKVNMQATLTCTGVDPDGDITAAQFDFGDYNNQVIAKNVGSPGSLSTTYSYVLPGAYRVTCKVRDNNNVYSGIPGACQQIVQVAVPIASQTIYTAGNSTPNPTVNPNPTAEVVQLQPYTPPTPIPTPIPSTTPEPAQNRSSFPWWLVGIGLAIIGVVILFVHGKKSKVMVPPQVPPQAPPPGPPLPTDTMPPQNPPYPQT